MTRQYELAHTLIASRESLAALDVGREPDQARDGLRAAPVRPVLPDRPPAGRGGHAVRAGQLEHARRRARGRRRRRLGHARPLLPDHARPPRLDARPGTLGLARRPARSGTARERRWSSRWASSAERPRSTTEPAASTGIPVIRPSWPAEACGAAGWSGPPTVAANIPSTGRSTPADLGATILARLGIGTDRPDRDQPHAQRASAIEELLLAMSG